ncbi:fimbrial protein [Cysteiniphilum sp. JM-1]|uniref:fimbrial protein n=1 Tax=Cysteiniphilum sp. JM-1 TaxID=2610891 RepID=UPI001247FF7C|nr:fimbrial protein [Cysteiniphilum sp. JM-1]
MAISTLKYLGLGVMFYCSLLSFADAADQDAVQLNFTATIQAELCQVDGSSTSLSYGFGAFTLANAKTTQDGYPVSSVSPISKSITLDCSSDPTGKLKLSFSSESQALEGNTILPLTINGTDSGIGVQLYNKSDASGSPLNMQSGTTTSIDNISPVSGDKYSFPLTAQLVYDSNIANAKTGDASASIVLNETSA